VSPPAKRTPRLAPPERRREILDATLALAADQGFDAVTMDAVARAAGITRPVVYDLFGDLAGLFEALAEREEERALDALADVIPAAGGPDDDPDEVLVTRLARFLEAVQADPPTWRLVLLPPDATPPELRERIERNRESIRAHLTELLAWGIDRRGGPAGVDLELLAHMLVVVGEDAARLVLAHPRRYPRERLVTFTREVLAALPGSPA
jgi:AcrR family transcriptional regulator